MMNTLRTILAIVCIMVIAICTVLLFQKAVGRARLDLTEHKHYTLSQGTRSILAQLNQPITLKFYYSKSAALTGPEQIRPFIDYALYVRDLLQEYEALANGMMTLEVIDPLRFSDEEEDALARGLKGAPLSADDFFFFGLAANTELGSEEIIEFFLPDRQEFVEYDISKLIVDVTRRKKRRVGVLSSLEVMGSDLSPYMMQMMRMQGQQAKQPWLIFTQLREQYEVEAIKKDALTIPATIDFLLVVHPKNLPEPTLFAIDQYVMKGGKLLVFVDPHCFADVPAANPRNPYAAMSHKSNSDLNQLLEGWGVEMAPKLIAADRTLAIMAGGGMGRRGTTILTYLGLTAKCVNQNEVIVTTLHELYFLFGGVLKPVAGAKTTLQPLLHTTAVAGTWEPANPFELMRPNFEAIRSAVKDGSEPLMLACRISGKLETNFPDGITIEEKQEAAPNKPDSKDDKEDGDVEKKTKKLAAIKEASADAMVLVFADVDMISDQIAFRRSLFGFEPQGDNVSLIYNALEYLSGSEELITVRSRGRFRRPFTVIEKIEKDAEKKKAKEEEALNTELEKSQAALQELLSGATGRDAESLKQNFVAKQNEIEVQIRKTRTKLRRLNAEKRKDIAALEASLEIGNTLLAPALVLLIAIVLALFRHLRNKRYVAGRTTP